MAKVRFNGNTLMDDDEGNFSYAPGIYTEKARGFEQMGRATGVIPRDLASEGTEHRVTLRFRGMSMSTIINRLEDAWTGEEGSLVCNGYPTVNNCWLAAPPIVSEGSSTAKIDGSSRGIGCTVQLLFLQVDR